jgi:GLPGLI family protein
MKTIIIISIALFLIANHGNAQNFSGIATYKTDRSMNLEEGEDDGMNDALRAQIQEQMKAQFRKEYTLHFTPTESLYKEVEKLDAPSKPNNAGITITVSGGSDVLYKNTETQKYVRESEIMQKEFLIEDQLQESDWKLEKESKNIGQYICFKATKTRTVTEKTFDTETNEFKDAEEEELVTIAWYTPSIPVSHGPDNYYGLPGLILEISDGELTILCSKITLNPTDGIVLEKPSKGKKVDQKEFDEIQKKKNDEMMERFNGSGRKNGGSSHTIEIRG